MREKGWDGMEDNQVHVRVYGDACMRVAVCVCVRGREIENRAITNDLRS